jgi:hypothetical protein
LYQVKKPFASLSKKINKIVGRMTSDTPISLNIHRENIKSVLESLRSGKACGIDEIPNEFLKHGGNTLLNSLLDLL